MPNILDTGEISLDLGEISRQNFNYDYPDELNLKPGTRLHDKIVTAVLQRARESANIMTNRHSDWNETDEKLTAYIPTSLKEQEIKTKDRRKPVSIVFPYSYAILETLISYMVAAFFPEPVFRYEGVSPEDTIGAMLLEKVINLHANKQKVALNLHTMFRDAGAYGFGAVAPQWTRKVGIKTVRQDDGFFNSSGEFVKTGDTKQEIETTLFEGNSLQNIDPYRYLPDPNVPLHEVQKGEYVGWIDRDNLLNLLGQEESQPPDDIDLFNVKYLRSVKNKFSSLFSGNKSKRTQRTGNSSDPVSRSTFNNAVDLVNMYVKLIPNTWKLGSSESPEKWMFTVASDSVLVRAKRLNLNHNMFPIALTAPDFDGYSPIAYSKLEILSGMQTVIDWLFNSHVSNVRKAINDVLIVDPYLLNINDLKDPGAGGLVRLRRPAWGRGVERAVQQLNVTDITRANIQDVAFVIQYMQQIASTDNPMMGSLRRGGPERLSAREFQGTAQGAVSRLERVARIIGIQAMQDIGYMFAHHTQQLMSQDVYVKAGGDWPQSLMETIGVRSGRAKVSPYDILVDYDLLVRDGSVPGGNFSDIWAQLFQIIGSNQELLQRFDIVRIFKHIAVNLGAKNVDDFELKQPVRTMTAPDEQVAQQVQNGNLTQLLGGIG